MGERPEAGGIGNSEESETLKKYLKLQKPKPIQNAHIVCCENSMLYHQASSRSSVCKVGTLKSLKEGTGQDRYGESQPFAHPCQLFSFFFFNEQQKQKQKNYQKLKH